VANSKRFPHFPANRVSWEMVKNQSPRLTGAAPFCKVAIALEMPSGATVRVP